MLVHIIVLAWVLILGCLVYQNGVSKSKNKRFVVLSFSLIFIVEALRRWDVGIDTPAYVNGFYNIRLSPWWGVGGSYENQVWEKGYVLLNKIIGTFTMNQQWLLGAVSAIILLGIGYFIVENLDDYTSAFWPVFLFVTFNFYFTSMVSLRQFCALAIGGNTYTVLKKGVTKKHLAIAIVLMILAMQFHSSAFGYVVVIAVFLVKKINRKIVVSTLLACFAALILFDPLLNLVFTLFPQYERYASGENEKFAGVALGEVYFLLFFIKFTCAVFVFMLDPQKEKNRELYILLVLNLISVGIALMTTKVQLVWRFGYYFDIFIILFIPKIIQRLRSGRKIAYILTMLSGFLYFGFLIYANEAWCVPYYFFWQ